MNREDIPGAKVGLVTLDRPPANALGKNMMAEMGILLNHLHENQNTGDDEFPRALVLHSALGPKVFCAGADLKERSRMADLGEIADLVSGLRSTFQRLQTLSVPVISVIDGAAFGGGLELAMAADIRIATETSNIGLTETSLGIVPGAGGTQRLPRLIGSARAKELIWTSRRMNGRTAFEYGIVEHVVKNGEEALQRALDIAWAISKNGPIAVRSAKWAINEGMLATSMEDALDIERQAYGNVLPTEDRDEGLLAFKEKREPRYRGR